MKWSMVLILILGVGGFLGAQEGFFSLEGGSLTTFNDNAPYLYQTGDGLALGFGRGPDDHFTFGLRLEANFGLKSPWTDQLSLSWSLASYTDTQYYYNHFYGAPAHAPWRLDAGSWQVLAEKSWDCWSAALGMGLLGRGNLGSEGLQNGFHKLLGILPLEIPFREDPAWGPFLAGILQWKVVEGTWLDWEWKPRLGGRGLWDPLGVLTQELSLLGTLKIERPGIGLEFTLGRRWSWPGNRDYLAEMYAGGVFWDGTLELNFGPALIQVGYSLNPFGSQAIPAYIYPDQNQAFHWTLVVGRDGPVPRAWRFFP